jgi:NitT/TauT family transport system ATP-binding protein
VEQAQSSDTLPESVTGSPVIGFHSVSKVFPDGTHTLTDISLEVRKAEFVALVGPSGCGKSTLLRIGAGLSRPSSGTVERPDPNLGFVFQDPTLLPWRTVLRNVELSAELHAISKEERRANAMEALRLVDLEEGFAHHYPKALSGGMKMRVSLARALTMKPPLFLLDEPFGALDEITREYLNDELLRLFLHERFGALFITHNLYEAIYLSSRVFVLSARPGRILMELKVPFGYPRTQDVRFDARFAELASQVSDALRGGS